MSGDSFDLTASPDDLARWRANLTFKEREIVALERISDQMEHFARTMGSTTCKMYPPDSAPIGDLQKSLPQGIEVIETRQFAVGTYRYTDLEDALAQWRREQFCSPNTADEISP